MKLQFYISMVTFILYLLGVSTNISFANLTAVRWGPEKDVININQNDHTYKSGKIEAKEFMGVTYDSRNGKFWAITRMDVGKQRLKELCEDSKSTIVSSLTSAKRGINSQEADFLLICLTSGISGVFSIDIVSLEYGELNVETGQWKSKGLLPLASSNTDTSTEAFVFAQDKYGTLHYINGDGKYFKKKKSDNDFKKVRGATFPIVSAYIGCGEFIDDDTMIGTGIDGNVFEYSIKKKTAISRVIEKNTFLMDVTNGPLSEICPSSTWTALESKNKKSGIIQIDSSSLEISTNHNVEESVGITHDSSTGKVYAITSNAGKQALTQICKSSDMTIADISPTSAQLVCLASGKKGTFALDMKAKYFGKLNIKTGTFVSIGRIKGPYNAYAFAQDSNGVLHYINGNGKHYDNSNDKNQMKPSGVIFQTKNLGICGEFDGSDLLAASTLKGTVRYSIIKSTTYAQTDDLKRSFTDITTNSITDNSCSQSENISPSSKSSKSSKKSSKKKSSKSSKSSKGSKKSSKISKSVEGQSLA